MTAQCELATHMNHVDAPLPASTAAEAGSEHQPVRLLEVLKRPGAGQEGPSLAILSLRDTM